MSALAWTEHPGLARDLKARGVTLVANSVLRKRLSTASAELPASRVTQALGELRAACGDSVAVVLAGTSQPDRLHHFATSLYSLQPEVLVEQSPVDRERCGNASAGGSGGGGSAGVGVGGGDDGGGADDGEDDDDDDCGREEGRSGGSGRLRVVLAQLPVVVGDVDANVRTLVACISRHAGHADLVVAPECYLSGFVRECRDAWTRALGCGCWCWCYCCCC